MKGRGGRDGREGTDVRAWKKRRGRPPTYGVREGDASGRGTHMHTAYSNKGTTCASMFFANKATTTARDSLRVNST